MKAARTPSDWDAIVIGGGPAGSSVATYLAREGRSVLVLERSRFPRAHVGESLLPGILPYLDALGVREKVEAAGFELKEGQTFIWGPDRTPWDIDFRELDAYPYSYFVDRAVFDDLLLRHSAESGAHVRQDHAVTRILFEKGRAVGVEFRGPDGNTHEARARFVVDASGQSALVARGADMRRPVRGLKNVALWSYWKGAKRLDGDRRTHILTVSIPAGWIWANPLADRMSVGIVTAKATRAERESLGPERWYMKTVRECAPVQALLDGATRVENVFGASDWSYRSRRLSGPGIFLVGDAACFIDPILSTGAYLAMTAAYWAAACIHSALSEPRLERFFRSFYDQTYGSTYRELITQVKAFYAVEPRRDSIYWTSKKVLRVGAAVKPDLAFLFITAGFLRNAATEAPHDPSAQLEATLGTRASVERLEAPHRAGTARGNAPSVRIPGQRGGPARRRSVSPPLVWRAGPSGAAQLVTLKADGLQLSLVPYEPSGLHDRPRESYFVLDLVDAERQPLALALVEERRAGQAGGAQAGSRVSVSVFPYPVRPRDDDLLHELEVQLARIVDEVDDTARPLAVRKLASPVRKRIRAEVGLLRGIALQPPRELRGGGIEQPPMTAVYAVPGSAGLDPGRLYVLVEARAPSDTTDLPVLRTRFLDVWLRPHATRDGRPLLDAEAIRDFVDPLCVALWESTRTARSVADAFERAEAVLTGDLPARHGFKVLGCGRLGDTAGEDATGDAGRTPG